MNQDKTKYWTPKHDDIGATNDKQDRKDRRYKVAFFTLLALIVCAFVVMAVLAVKGWV